MTEHEGETGTGGEEREQVDEQEGGGDLLEQQSGKGYGDDEGERDEALEQTNWEKL